MAFTRVHRGAPEVAALLRAIRAAARAGMVAALCVVNDESRATDRTLELEFDHGPTAAQDPIRSCTVNGRSRSLRSTFADAEYILSDTLGGLETTVPSCESDSCYISRGELDSNLYYTAQPPSSSTWYAHGLAIPHEGYRDDLSASGMTTLRGMLWQLGEVPTTDAAGITIDPCDPAAPPDPNACCGNCRRHFVLFYGADFSPDPVRYKFTTAVHELGHLLNLHHQDYKACSKVDSEGTFGQGSNYCKKHLMREAGTAPSHVSPGPSGDQWCGPTDAQKDHNRNYHGDPEFMDCDSSSKAADPDTGVDLILEAEKDHYYSGEPIHINLTLDLRNRRLGNARAIQLLPDSLRPELGYLTLWVGPSRESQPKRLRSPLYVEAPPRARDASTASPAPGPHVLRGVGIWYTLPESGMDIDGDFWLKATMHGFRSPQQVIESVPIPIRVIGSRPHRPELDQPEARALFTDAQARRFLYLMGGDHLAGGINKLEQISTHHPDTIYAPYANLALGVRWSRSFSGLDAARDPILRPPDCNKARDYLEKAGSREHDLPSSYRRLLARTLSEVNHICPAPDPTHRPREEDPPEGGGAVN